MKKLSFILACLMTAAVVTGCNTQTGTDSADGQTTDPQTSETAGTDTTTGESFTLLSWNNEQNMAPYLEGFEAETGIKVDLQFVPPVQQYVDKFMVLVSSKQMTDMFYTAAENKEEVIEKDLAVDISALPIFERIDENISATYGNEGKIYAYSPDAWVGGIFYNKALFEQAGIAKEPETWDELVQTMQALKDLGVESLVSGSDSVHELSNALFVSQKISQNPRLDYDINEGKTTFAAEYTDSYQTWYNDVYAAGLFSQISLGLNADQALDMFVTGETAMYSGGPWNIATIEEKNPDLEYGVFAVPDEDGNTMLGGAVNVGLSISTSSEKQDAAWQFLEYMSKDENILNWQKTTGNVLVVEGIDYEMDTVINQFKDDAVDGKFYLQQIVWKNSAAIYKEMLAGIQDAMTGADTIENVPVRMDAKMQELG